MSADTGGCTYRGSSGGHEDQTTQVRSTFVAQSTGSVDQSADTIRLNGRANQGATPGGSRIGGLFRLEEFFFCVGSLSAVVGIPEDGREDGERCRVAEDRAQSDR